jgi:putative hydrolase of the HAD superfamily
MTKKPLVIFDGDDTLWVTQPLYNEAKTDMQAMVESVGFDPEIYLSELERLDVERVKGLGFKRERFPGSALIAYEDLCSKMKREVDLDLSDKIYSRANAVFETPAPLIDGADEILKTLKSKFQLALLTKGAPSVQTPRIAVSGLASLFDSVHVVEDKTEKSYADVIKQHEVKGEQTCSIGNSVPSDILPALACGAYGLWLDVLSWNYDRRTELKLNDNAIRIESLREVPELVSKMLIDFKLLVENDLSL